MVNYIQRGEGMDKQNSICVDYFDGKGFVNYGMHRHDSYEMLFVLEGALKFLCGDKIYACDGSCILFFREKKLHTTEVDPQQNYRRYNVNFKLGELSERISYDSIRHILEPDCFIMPVKQCDREDFEALFAVLCRAASDEGVKGEACAELEKNILGAILAKCALAETDSIKKNEFVVHTYITDVIKYIDENISSKLVISDIASVFFISRAKLISDFRAATGITIGELILAKRMRLAKSLLKKGMSVNAVSAECGFANTCHFIRTFKNFTGTTPLKYSRG